MDLRLFTVLQTNTDVSIMEDDEEKSERLPVPLGESKKDFWDWILSLNLVFLLFFVYGIVFAIDYSEGFTKSNVKYFIIFLAVIILFFHGYAEDTGLRKMPFYQRIENRIIAFLAWLVRPFYNFLKSFGNKFVEKVLIPSIPVFKFLWKFFLWAVGIGIVLGLGYAFFGFLGSLSVSTLLIIIIVILLFR